MKKILLGVLILFITFPHTLPIKALAYEGGLLAGKMFYVGTSVTNKSDFTYLITDQDETTYYSPDYDTNSWVWYEFDEAQDIVAYQMKALSGVFRLNFYNSSGNVIKYYTGTTLDVSGKKVSVNLNGVKKIGIRLVNSSDGIKPIYEFDVFSKYTPPPVPTGLKATADIESVDLIWDPVNDENLAGYNVFVNSTKVNNDLIQGRTYTVMNLTPDVNYAFQVSAINKGGLESNRSITVNAAPLSKVVNPTLTATNIEHDRLKLQWDAVGRKYEVYQDGKLISRSDYLNTYIDVTGLEPLTNYTFKVIAIDRYGRRNESNVIVVKTIAPTPKINSVSVVNKTHNSFEIQWELDRNTEVYEVYLNGVLKGTTTENRFSFLGLSPGTIYSFKVIAKSTIGQAEYSSSTTTNAAPIPEIYNARVEPVVNQLTKRKLFYSASPMVTGVKVYLDGILIGEFPIGEDIELDLADIEKDFALVKVEPIDENGKSYEFQALTKTVGNADLDAVVGKFLNGFSLYKNAFWYLAIISIPLVLAVLIFLWLRRKFKKTFGESKKEKAALINQPSGEPQYIRDFKEERRKYIPWKEMTQEQRNEWRQSKGKHIKKPLTDGERQNFEIGNSMKLVEKKYRKIPLGIMGSAGFKFKPDFTYEKNGVQYKRRYVKGQGMVFQPKDFRNQVKYVSNQLNAVKSAFTGSNKKKF